MKILILPCTVSEPIHTGYAIRVAETVKGLGATDEVTLVGRADHAVSAQRLRELYGASTRFEVITVPRPDYATKLRKGLAGIVSPYPVTAAGMYFESVRHRLEQLSAGERFDAVIVEGHHAIRHLRPGMFPGARRVLVEHNVESKLMERNAELARGPRRLLATVDAKRMDRWELNTLGWADVVVCVSESDSAVFRQRAPHASVVVAPNGVDCRAKLPLPVASGNDILFVGALDYYPNIQGLDGFVTRVMPRIRERVSDANLIVVGRRPGPAARRVAEQPGVELAGEVDEVEPYYRRASVVVVPLQTGGGTRLKILEAFAYGRPVVSTTIGHEGIAAGSETGDVLIGTDDEAQFADAVVRLLADLPAREAIAERARRVAETTYDWPQIIATIREACTAGGEPRREPAQPSPEPGTLRGRRGGYQRSSRS